MSRLMDAPVLHVERSGQPPGAETFVLLHGFGTSSFTWRRWLPWLEHRGHVVRIDLLGCGASPRPKNASYGPEAQASLVLDTLARENVSRPIVIGHSLGGGVALLVTLALSDLGAPPRKLVLVASAAYPQRLPPFVTLASWPGLWRVAMREPWLSLVVAQVLRSIVVDTGVVTPELVEGHAAPLRQPGSAAALVASATHLLPSDFERLTSRYPALTVPSLLIWGRQDRVVPPWVGERLASELPDATLRMVDGCGHLPHEEAPTRTLALLESFLER